MAFLFYNPDYMYWTNGHTGGYRALIESQPTSVVALPADCAIDRFKFQDSYDREIRCPNTYVKYGKAYYDDCCVETFFSNTVFDLISSSDLKTML